VLKIPSSSLVAKVGDEGIFFNFKFSGDHEGRALVKIYRLYVQCLSVTHVLWQYGTS